MESQKISRKSSSNAKDCVVVVDNVDHHEAKSEILSLSSGNKNFDQSYDQYFLGKPYHNYNNSYNVHSLVESMPLPEPIWSTTQPCILASNFSSCNNNPNDLLDLEELLFDDEFEDYNHHEQASPSSYTWWVGFLKSLDGESNGDEYFYKCPNEYGCESNNVTPFVVDVISSGASDKSVFGTTDEWLSFPNTPKDEGETTIPIIP